MARLRRATTEQMEPASSRQPRHHPWGHHAARQRHQGPWGLHAADGASCSVATDSAIGRSFVLCHISYSLRFMAISSSRRLISYDLLDTPVTPQWNRNMWRNIRLSSLHFRITLKLLPET